MVNTHLSYELQEEMLWPVNRLTVRIADTMDAEIPRESKKESHISGEVSIQTYSGAVRSV